MANQFKPWNLGWVFALNHLVDSAGTYASGRSNLSNG
jgi:hypothetical protein